MAMDQVNSIFPRSVFDEGVKLIITVDSGISGLSQIQFAKDLGMDVSCDRPSRTWGSTSSSEYIIQSGTKRYYLSIPYLAGVGVAFKVAHALLIRYQKNTIT